jgi:hypothetical protein
MSALILSATACHSSANGETPVTTSPQAKAEPAALSNVAADATEDAAIPLRSGDGGFSPSALPLDAPSASDMPMLAKEVHAIYTLSAVFRTLDAPPIPRGPDISVAALEQARKKLELRHSIDMGAGRMRWVIDGPGHLVGENVELRDRSDRLGHVFLFAGETRYRAGAPGTLRSFFLEGRYDSTPMLPAKVIVSGVGYRLGYRTRVLEVSTGAGRVTLEVAKVADLADGGHLLCQALVEWVRALPLASTCAPDEVPLHAEFHWQPRGGAAFEVTRLQKRDPSYISRLACPPSSAKFTTEAPPRASTRSYVSESELAQFHQQTAEIPITRDAPRGLLAINHSGSIRVLWADGVPVAQLLPNDSHLISGLARGRYQIQWRTPEGNSEPILSVVAPGKTELGIPDSNR